MPRKRVDVRTDPLEVWTTGKELPDPWAFPTFSSGAAAEILGLPDWRLQKFLGSHRYRLAASAEPADGWGSRRWFTTTDLYRIGMANYLAKDGFAPKRIAQIVQRFDDRDLLNWDEEGGQVRAGFVALIRTKAAREVEDFPPERPPEIKLDGPVYYVLDVGKLTQEIDSQIEKVTAKKGRIQERG